MFVDKDRTGFMTSTQFSDFLEMLHPYEKLRCASAAIAAAIAAAAVLVYVTNLRAGPNV